MPTVDFGACLANYWFVWTVNSLGSIFGLAINMAVSYFFLKYFHNIQGSLPSTKKTPTIPFQNLNQDSPPIGSSRV